jgi:hypothetical protein
VAKCSLKNLFFFENWQNFQRKHGIRDKIKILAIGRGLKVKRRSFSHYGGELKVILTCDNKLCTLIINRA